MSNIEYSSRYMIKIDEQKITTAWTGQRKKNPIYGILFGDDTVDRGCSINGQTYANTNYIRGHKPKWWFRGSMNL